ncbi:MAG: hypothetical protein IRZ16_22510 [Myxococcaceae bacterium]|nr:hypothetical protein [Myxococcaceae bacterium]
MVGKHAVEAATQYGSIRRSRDFGDRGLSGVEVTVIGRELTGSETYMRQKLTATEVLIDVTQRSDPTRPLIPNERIGHLPSHAVVCDLVVDPYVLQSDPPTERSLEGIPRGDLDPFKFLPNDPAWTKTIPASIPSKHRRATATCSSRPGVHPKEYTARYGELLLPCSTA